MRVGIFGGSFNPPHLGHLNSLQTVAKKAGLDQIRVVPAAQNPLKIEIEGAGAEQRLEMTKLALQGWGAQFVVDDQEIRRGGKSYTIDTIKNIRKEVEAEDLFLILGMDQFDQFSSWKKYDKILSEANLIFTSRPGFQFPDSVEELPEYLKSLVADFDFNFIELNTGRSIQFIKLEDIAVSATQIRKNIRIGRNVSKMIPLSVETYIRDHNIYKTGDTKIKNYEQFTDFCAQVLYSRKALQVKGFDLRQMSAPSEFAIVCSGSSTRHTSSLGENLMKVVKEEFNLYPQNVEGVDEGRWVIMDYGALIVHVFYDYIRQEYSIEKLWNQAKEINLVEKPDFLNIQQ